MKNNNNMMMSKDTRSKNAEKKDPYMYKKCRKFSSDDILGDFGWSYSGVSTSPNAVYSSSGVEFVDVGTISFFPDGICEGTGVANVGGIKYSGITSSNCSYEVSENGTGTIRTTILNGPATLDQEYSFVIVQEGNEIRFIRSDSAGLAEGVMKRQC